MKLLKSFQHQGYKINIYGEYKEESVKSVTLDGKVYSGQINTKYAIFHEDKCVSSKTFNDHDYILHMLSYDSRIPYENIALYRVETTGFLFWKKKRLITIKEDLERIIDNITCRTKERVDTIIFHKNREQREKEITDGLMDSLDNIKPKDVSR